MAGPAADSHWLAAGAVLDSGALDRLSAAVSFAATDAAGPTLPVARAALLELAGAHMGAGAAGQAHAALQAAARAAACLSVLQRGAAGLGQVPPPAVPAWAAQLLNGEPTLQLRHHQVWRETAGQGRAAP